MLRPDAGPRLLGVGSDLCWPPRPPAVGPEGLHELAQKVVALCAVTERALEGLPAAAADALAGHQWQDLAERERALQRRCVELDERERQMELAFGQLDELRRHSLDLLVGLDRRSQAVVQRERDAVDMRVELDRLFAVHAALVERAPEAVKGEREGMREEELESTRAELQRARREATGLRDELRGQEAGAALRLEKVAGVLSRLAAEIPMHPQVEGGPDWPVPGGGAGRVARQGPTAGPLTPCSPGARVQAVQGPEWSAGAGLWGGLDAGGVQAGSGAEEVWAEPGEGGARDVAAWGADPGGAPSRGWP